MHERDSRLLETLFKRHYFENASAVSAPRRTREREFGYMKFGSGMVRHIAIKDEDELRLLLVSNAPSDAYCSNAYYSFPDLEMNQKDWKGADLIFDIDAKDLHLDCRKKHTVFRCSQCHAASAGSSQCRSCESAKGTSVSVTCSSCITASKAELKKLNEVLVEDLGLRPEDIQIYFSGNEGFHVHARAAQLEALSFRERGELADYIGFKGAIPERFGMSRQQTKETLRYTLPKLNGEGWEGRVAREIFGSKVKRTRFIAALGDDAYGTYGKMLQDAAEKIGVRIDRNVTTDVHRIFRLPHSLNGKSGLAKVPCEEIDAFDPYTEACVLDDTPVQVTADCPVEFKLNGDRFGPYSSEPVELPGYAAAYMICKGLARAAERRDTAR